MMVKSVPEGWHTVTPRIVVSDVEKLIEFLKRTFGATGEISGKSQLTKRTYR